MLVDFEIFIKAVEGLIFGQPVLFVLMSGLVFFVISASGDSITYWAARLGGLPLMERMPRWFRMDTIQVNQVRLTKFESKLGYLVRF